MIVRLFILILSIVLSVLPAAESPQPADGTQDIYAVIMIGETQGMNADQGYRAYGILSGRLPCPYSLQVTPDHIRLLGFAAPPTTYADVPWEPLDQAHITQAMEWLATAVDADDLVIVYFTGAGTGYLGFHPPAPWSALHGFVGSTISMSPSSGPDATEFGENAADEFGWSIICSADGTKGTRELHSGMNQWSIHEYPEYLLYRTMIVSKFERLYTPNSPLPLDDQDIYLERLTNHCKGDLNHNGLIDPGETFDWDADGEFPWSEATGAMDEDDWELECTVEDDWNNPHSCLGAIPFQLLDVDLDGRMDVDLYPDGNLTIDATDLNNNGLFDDGIDINGDGDTDDRFGIDEGWAVLDGCLSDDMFALLWKNIPCRRIIAGDSCYFAGFAADLASPDSIFYSPQPVNSLIGAGSLSLLNDALQTSTSDLNNDGTLSVEEWFTNATRHRWVNIATTPVIDDDGNGIPSVIDENTDWGLSSSTFLGTIKTATPPTVSISIDEPWVWEEGSYHINFTISEPDELALFFDAKVEDVTNGSATTIETLRVVVSSGTANLAIWRYEHADSIASHRRIRITPTRLTGYRCDPEFAEITIIDPSAAAAPAPIVSNLQYSITSSIPDLTWISGGLGGIGTYQISIDNSPWILVHATSYTPSPLTVGLHSLRVQECNLAGFWGDIGLGSIEVTATSPVVPNAPIVSISVNTPDNRPTWNWTSTISGDEPKTYRFRLDDNEWSQTNETSFTPASPLPDGAWTLEVQELRSLALWSTSGSATTHIDTIRPIATISCSSATVTTLAVITATVVLSEPVESLNTDCITASGGSIQDITGAGTTWLISIIAGPSMGQMEINVGAGAAHDAAGNTNHSISTSVQIVSKGTQASSNAADDVSGGGCGMGSIALIVIMSTACGAMKRNQTPKFTHGN